MRTQLHSSNPEGRCDHCGKLAAEHLTGDYYCPPDKVRRVCAFHCDFGCKVPSHKPGCPFYRGSSKPGEKP